MLWIGMVALTTCMFVPAPREVQGLPATDPHAFINRVENCSCCHETLDNGTIDPHAFTVDVVESCSACHSGEMLGTSHPLNVLAAKQLPQTADPAAIPLDADGRITCGTCHNPHLDGLTTERYAPSQEPGDIRSEQGVEVAYYRSYMLRFHAPDAGNDPTCAACHQDYF